VDRFLDRIVDAKYSHAEAKQTTDLERYSSPTFFLSFFGRNAMKEKEKEIKARQSGKHHEKVHACTFCRNIR